MTVSPVHSRRGMTLLELMIVIAVISVLAALARPASQPNVHEQLAAAAQLLAGDLSYGRSLAVANNSRYTFTFDAANSRYTLKHSGTNAALNVLPQTAFSRTAGAVAQTTDLGDLTHQAAKLALYSVRAVGTSASSAITTVEFGPLGQTTETRKTQIWLSAGTPTTLRYALVEINPVTGLVTIGGISIPQPVAL